MRRRGKAAGVLQEEAEGPHRLLTAHRLLQAVTGCYRLLGTLVTLWFKMKPYASSLLLWLCSLTLGHCSVSERAYFMFADFWCLVGSGDGPGEPQVEYLVDWYFNEEFTMRYNSTVGKWRGLTRAGLITASAFNRDEHDLWQRKVEKKMICENNVPLLFNATKENMAEPSVTLQRADPSVSYHAATLVCSAQDFYPEVISMTWQRHGQEVTSGVTWSDVMSNGDWTYQVHSYLELVPGREDGLSCVVEHASLKEPKSYEWDTSWSSSERNCVIGGVFALLVGAVFLSTGILKYRKRCCNAHL